MAAERPIINVQYHPGKAKQSRTYIAESPFRRADGASPSGCPMRVVEFPLARIELGTSSIVARPRGTLKAY